MHVVNCDSFSGGGRGFKGHGSCSSTKVKCQRPGLLRFLAAIICFQTPACGSGIFKDLFGFYS